MRRRAAPVLLAALGTLLILAGLAPGASAGDALTNGAFDTWSGPTPDGWDTIGDVSPSDAGCRSGRCALVAAAGELSQSVTLTGAAAFTALVWAKSLSGSPRVSLDVAFLDAGFLPVGIPVVATGFPGSDFATITATGSTPPGASFARVRVIVTDGGALLDDASFDLTPLNTPSPDPTDTPTATPTLTATATPTHAPVPSPTRTPTPTPTFVPEAPPPPPTPRPSPTPTAPSRRVPAIAPAGGSGGLLADGDFEFVTDGAPAFWDATGGRLTSERDALTGSWSAMLLSASEATKWVSQLVAIEPGRWYAGRVAARLVAGEAELFLRITWYSSHDGEDELLSQEDSAVTASHDWTVLTLGPIQAPLPARTARFRLMLRPKSGAAALFDDARLAAVQAPTPVTPTATRTPSPASLVATVVTSSAALSAVVAPPAAAPPANEAATPVPSAVTTSPVSVRLSEVMVDPLEPGRDNGFEWVELENTGPEPVDLAGWQLGDNRKLAPLPAYSLAPGAFVVVAGRDAVFGPSVPLLRIPGGTIGSGLNNAGDAVRLVAPDGSLASSLSYGEDATAGPRAPRAPAAGEALALDPDGRWRVALRPTPGEANAFAAAAAPPPPSRTPADARAATAWGDGPTPVALLEFAGTRTDGSSWLWPLSLAASAAAAALGLGLLARRRSRAPGGSNHAR
jgi:hypothetical protein